MQQPSTSSSWSAPRPWETVNSYQQQAAGNYYGDEGSYNDSSNYYSGDGGGYMQEADYYDAGTSGGGGYVEDGSSIYNSDQQNYYASGGGGYNDANTAAVDDASLLNEIRFPEWQQGDEGQEDVMGQVEDWD